jgi:hypothetical protein
MLPSDPLTVHEPEELPSATWTTEPWTWTTIERRRQERSLLIVLTLLGYIAVFLVGVYVGGWRP